MQNAKDTFYVTLRNRLATLNPNRTMMLREVGRASWSKKPRRQCPCCQRMLLVLRWTTLAPTSICPWVLARLDCEILYTTGGAADRPTSTSGGR